MNKKISTQCRKPKGSYCRIHNPAPITATVSQSSANISIVHAQNRINSLFEKSNVKAEERLVTELANLHHLTQDADKVTRLIPFGSRGEIVVNRQSGLGKIYHTILDVSNAGECTEIFKNEYEAAKKEASDLQNQIDFLEEEGSPSLDLHAAFHGSLLKTQLLRLGYFNSTTAHNFTSEWDIVYETTSDYQHSTVADYDELVSLKKRLAPENPETIISGFIQYRVDHNQPVTIAEIHSLDGQFTSRVDVNGQQFFLPFITHNSKKFN